MGANEKTKLPDLSSTVPPPGDGDTDVYSAKTKVGPLPAPVLAAMLDFVAQEEECEAERASSSSRLKAAIARQEEEPPVPAEPAPTREQRVEPEDLAPPAQASDGTAGGDAGMLGARQADAPPAPRMPSPIVDDLVATNQAPVAAPALAAFMAPQRPRSRIGYLLIPLVLVVLALAGWWVTSHASM
jgi:hypothetical protein